MRARKTSLSTAGKTKKQTDVQQQYQSQLGQRCRHDICLFFANNIILLFITIMIV